MPMCVRVCEPPNQSGWNSNQTQNSYIRKKSNKKQQQQLQIYRTIKFNTVFGSAVACFSLFRFTRGEIFQKQKQNDSWLYFSIVCAISLRL